MMHGINRKSAAFLLLSVSLSMAPLTPVAAAAVCQAEQPGGCVLPIKDPAPIRPGTTRLIQPRKGIGAAPILGGIALAALIAALAFSGDGDNEPASPD